MKLRRRYRSERGATTAEYVGILVFVALLVLGVIAVSTSVGDSAGSGIRRAYCKIASTVGVGGGCTNADAPFYEEHTCTVSATGREWGGSVSVVGTAGGDTGYTILKVQEVMPDGSVKTSYVVKTKGKGNISWSPGEKAGVEASTGDSTKGAKGGVQLKISGEVETGQTFEFDSLEDAQKFADDNKDNFGGLFGQDGDVKPTTTYYQAGAGAEVSGSAGPLKLKGGGKTILGVETTDSGPNAGDVKYKVALTYTAAAELGLPLPTDMVNAAAKGDLNLTVEANITFDKDGNLKQIQGKAEGTAKGGAEVALGPSSSQQKAETGGDTTVKLPNVNIKGGVKGTYTFSTDFSDSANNAALTQGFTDVLNGHGITPEFKDAVANQFRDHSKQTFTWGTVDETKDEYGLKVSTPIGDFGAEGHTVETNEGTKGGWYYDPVEGTWKENLACTA